MHFIKENKKPLTAIETTSKEKNIYVMVQKVFSFKATMHRLKSMFFINRNCYR